MTTLSNRELQKSMEDGALVISPILHPNQVGPASVDIRLGNVAMVVRNSNLTHLSPLDYRQDNSDVIDVHHRKLERVDLPFFEQLIVHPGALILAPSFEWFSLPANLRGIVTARSTWAREGLNIATATFINPGYAGIITLELTNLGQIPISIYPGQRIAQIALQRMTDDEVEATGDGGRKYASQFAQSFEPTPGNIASLDEPFLPRHS